MQCKGKFIFKSLTENKGGEFTNANGQIIKYNPSYSLKVDEITEDNKVNERVFKFPVDYKELHNKLSIMEMYTQVILTFNITFYNNQVRCVPVDVTTEIN